jgi:hypothetical protein
MRVADENHLFSDKRNEKAFIVPISLFLLSLQRQAPFCKSRFHCHRREDMDVRSRFL